MRQRRSHTYPWRANVHCQRFFTHGPRQEYFEVAPQDPSPDDTNPSAPAVPASNMARDGQHELERIQQKQAELASRQAVAQPEMSDTNPWLERVEWAHHLAGFTFEEMIPWAVLPRDDEITLQRICSA